MIEERNTWKREIFLNDQCSIVFVSSDEKKVFLAEVLLAEIHYYFRQMPPLGAGAVEIRLPFFDRLAIDDFSNGECIPLFSSLPPRSFELDSMTSLPVFLEKTIGWSQKIVKVEVDSRLLLLCSDPSGHLGDHSAQQRAADMLAVALGRTLRRGIPAQDCTLFLECMFLYLRALYEAVRKIQRESIYATV